MRVDSLTFDERIARADELNRREHEAQGLPYPNPDPVRKARAERILFGSPSPALSSCAECGRPCTGERCSECEHRPEAA